MDTITLTVNEADPSRFEVNSWPPSENYVVSCVSLPGPACFVFSVFSILSHSVI